MPVIPALRRLRQDSSQVQVLNYVARLCLQKKKIKAKKVIMSHVTAWMNPNDAEWIKIKKKNNHNQQQGKHFMIQSCRCQTKLTETEPNGGCYSGQSQARKNSSFMAFPFQDRKPDSVALNFILPMVTVVVCLSICPFIHPSVRPPLQYPFSDSEHKENPLVIVHFP